MVTLLLTVVLAQAPSPQFVATTPSGTTTGSVASLGKSWALTLDGQPVADLVSLRKAGTPLPAWPRTAGVILANGDRIPGELVGGDDAAVTLKSAWQAKGLRLPLAGIRVLWLVPVPADASDFPDRYPWLDADRKADVVLLRNGDTVAGDIEAFGEGGSLKLRRKSDGTAVTLAASATAAVAFNPGLTAVRKIKGPYARVVLTDGTRLTATSATLDADVLRGTTAFGGPFEVPAAKLVAVDVLQGKAVELASLKPKAEAVEPFNDLAWPWAANRTVKARPLRLTTPAGPSTFDAGLGTHPRTTLTYALGGKYRRFTAFVGLDADTGRRGAASVRILVDGKEQAVPGLAKVTAAAGTVAVSVAVGGAKELTLAIDFGPAGHVQADVNWADAKLIE